MDGKAWIEWLRSIFDSVREEFGLFPALLLFAAVFLFVQLQRSWNARLKDKDAEMARLVDSRNRLEDVVLKNRAGSGLNRNAETQPRNETEES